MPAATPNSDRHLDDTDPLMSIGMFSRASLVSVKALRSYHEQGLLVPDSVDPSSGYRSYRVSQLADAVIIKRLRDLDVPLRDIAEIVGARDPDVTKKVIAEHEADMRRRLDEVTRIVDELQEAIDRPSLHTPVHVRDEAATHALAFSGFVDESDYATFLDGAYAALFAAVDMSGAIPTGSGSARYPAAVDTDQEPVEAYVPIAAPIPIPSGVHDTGVVLTLIPAATCAVATHIGGYDTIGDTYRLLGAWVARHATSADLPVREHYVVSTDPDTHELLPPEQLRTEICWPIVPGSASA
ncbi:MerR family transcriptional regulator [Ilumatobacter coccineus]|uniref:Putative MerR family transcriptional regulator n=1 Tax=Ilumatobacter coccineus (strain NBRC 103263 / KCTC 29153 / YM16-304) TaxID=1313172 RepID=A0A6C7EBE6_ILUCY|nr:MerR family transcriptional regulator [Ilumatobacter coccineus]BAN03710.1 putative MerR family transcriptional regulator [Ilumatobacter coccineus YM16-304]